MFIQVDKHSGIPAYLQIMNQIKKEIIIGNLKINDQLPTIREMQKIFGVNINTVSRALERLAMENLVDPQHGVGYFIKESTNSIDENLLEEIKKIVSRLKEKQIDYNTANLVFEEVWKND